MKTISPFIRTFLAGFPAQTRHAQTVGFPILLVMTMLSSARATETSFQGSLGDWFIDSNWTNGVPGGAFVAEQDAFITNGGSALLNRLETNTFGGPGMPAEAADVFIGQIKNTSGTLLVTRLGGAPPASLRLTNLYIGLGGGPGTGTGATGAVIISSGASVVTGNAGFGATVTTIGKGSQASGTLTVTDPGSSLHTNFVFLGDDTSMGTLNIQNGARVTTRVASIAGSHFDLNPASGSSGSATVTGAGSGWIILDDGNFEVGSKGTGSLIISSGGRVDSLGTSIATYAGSNGAVHVTGNGSSWGAGYVDVGGAGPANGGSGTLRIQNGGLVQASRVKCFANSVVDVNNDSSSVPGLIVEGGGAGPVAGGSPGDVLVGSTTGGRMEIRAGGHVSSLRGHIGFHPGSDGAVSVNGSGATWMAAGSLFIGNGGVGSVEVLNGGSVTSAGHGYLGFSTNTSGQVNVSGAGSTLSFAQNLFIGGNAAAAGGSGSLAIQNGGVVSAATARLYPGAYLGLGADASLNAPLTVTGGNIAVSADITFSNSFTVEAGGLNVFSGTHRAIFSGQILGTGGLTKQSAGFTSPQPGTLTLTGASSYTGETIVNAGKLVIEGSITSDVTVNSGGALGGNGAVGSVTVNPGGVVEPGDSPGQLTVNGNYTQKSGGILNIELGGNTPGAGGYDQLVVTGTATLNGTLNLKLVKGFLPAPGDTFSILTSSAETGNFTTINSPGFTVTSAAIGSAITVTVTAVAPPLQILSMARNGENISITFEATAAQTYQLERNFTLSPLTWDAISGDYTPAADGPVEMVDAGGANFPKAFYRVILAP